MSYSKLEFVQRVKKGKKNLQHVKFGLKNFATRQILKWNFYNCVTFWIKVLQRVRFLVKHFYNVSEYKTKIFQKVRFGIKCLSTCRIWEKMFKFKKSCFGYFYSVKSIFFAFFSFLQRNISNQILHNLSDFELKKNTTRENFNWIFCIASDFDMKFNNVLEL